MLSVNDTPKREITRRAPSIAAGLIVALLATGCASSTHDRLTVGTVPDDYRTRHPIVVAENQVVEAIPVTTNTKSLSLRHRNVVVDFANRFRRSGSRYMQIVVPVGSSNEGAANAVARSIVATLGDNGITASQIALSNYQADGAGAPIQLAFMSLTAEAGPCGEWPEDISVTGQNRQYHNFGCATQNNLAKMIANPADLVGPRGESEIDSTRRDNVITNWRTNGSEDLTSQF